MSPRSELDLSTRPKASASCNMLALSSDESESSSAPSPTCRRFADLAPSILRLSTFFNGVYTDTDALRCFIVSDRRLGVVLADTDAGSTLTLAWRRDFRR